MTMTQLITVITEIMTFIFTNITTVFTTITDTPLLLIPVALMVTGSLFGFAGRLMSVARGR